MIPETFIQELLARVDIVDVVERYVRLKKSGQNYVACCPFHSEKTPSFTVSPSKQFYHCFGCGAHGTAIGFLMQYQGLGFVEAVEALAQSVGLVVPRTHAGASRAPTTPGLYGVLREALRYYREALKDSPEAAAYLKGRGITGEIAARFGLGYAPSGWQNLAAVFPDYARSQLLRDAGLVIDHEGGRRYDRFRDRIMFPILDARGNVIGFGGRVLGAGEPKYLNSPETPVFHKGQELYGLPQARQAIRARGRAVVVEGYMDAIACAQHGVEEVVASLGTAITGEQVRRLLKLAPVIVFCFDGDAAGRKAAWRALENSLPVVADGASLSFCFLPEGEDPDSFLRRNGRDAFAARLDRGVSLSRFLLQELAGRHDLATPEGRAALIETAKPLIAQVNAPALALLLRKELAEAVGLTAAELDSLLPASRGGPAPRTRRVPARLAPSRDRAILRMLVARPGLGVDVSWDEDMAEGPEGKVVAAVLAHLARHPHIETGAMLLESFRGREEEPWLEAAAAEAMMLSEGFDLEREFADAIAKARAAARRRRIDRLLALDRSQGLTPEQKQELVRELAAAQRS